MMPATATASAFVNRLIITTDQSCLLKRKGEVPEPDTVDDGVQRGAAGAVPVAGGDALDRTAGQSTRSKPDAQLVQHRGPPPPAPPAKVCITPTVSDPG